jgi:hypothetical protein
MTDEELAGAYVLGTLSSAEREGLGHRLVEDRTFLASVEAWDARLGGLAGRDEVPVPGDLFSKIEARIATSGTELPGTTTVRAGAGSWVQVSPGLRIKMLNEIPALGRHTFMAELQAGAEYVGHDHDQDEEIFMISGDLAIGSLVLGAGDFHVARAGKHHPAHTTRGGCVCIISQAKGPV